MSTSIAQFQSTRISRRIDYSSSRVMRRRRLDKIEQRARARKGTWVVGRFIHADDAIAFEAVAMQPGYWIDRNALLTRAVSSFYRWCTRQAARQWLLRNPDDRLEPINLRQLRGGDDQGSRRRVVTATTQIQTKSPAAALTVR